MTFALSDTLTLGEARADAVPLPSVKVLLSKASGESLAEAKLGIEPLVVGASPDCDIAVKDPRMSRRHCELRITERGVILRDLNSKNGTYINKVPILEAILALDALVELGNSTLRLVASGRTTLIPLSPSARFGGAVGASLAMRAVFAKLEKAAPTSETILLLGESGTGKEVLAKAVHDQSPRKGGPFVIFDCSAVAPNLVEDELFGHEKGAYTGANNARAGVLEQAHEGTLFIDELGELPLDLQPKLLRALESRQYRRLGASAHRRFDTRIVAATHRDLRTRIAQNQFREDLYYRLAVAEIHIPPLRERREDIPLLVDRFLNLQTPPRSINDLPPNAMALLESHHWPGNVRELRNTVARFVLFGEEALPPVSSRQTSLVPPPPSSQPASFAGMTLSAAREKVLEDFEKRYIAKRLSEHSGNVTRAADAMGVSRQYLHKLMDKYGMKGGGVREGT